MCDKTTQRESRKSCTLSIPGEVFWKYYANNDMWRTGVENKNKCSLVKIKIFCSSYVGKMSCSHFTD